jgi:hypothetical protein
LKEEDWMELEAQQQAPLDAPRSVARIVERGTRCRSWPTRCKSGGQLELITGDLRHPDPQPGRAGRRQQNVLDHVAARKAHRHPEAALADSGFTRITHAFNA